MPVHAASNRSGEQLAVQTPLTSILHEMPDEKSKLPHGLLPPPSAARASLAKPAVTAKVIAKTDAPNCPFAHPHPKTMAPPLDKTQSKDTRSDEQAANPHLQRARELHGPTARLRRGDAFRDEDLA